MSLEKQAEIFTEAFTRLRREIEKVMVGQQEVIENTLVCFFAGGHALLEGLPGLGKTVLVRTLADACDLEFARIQFTPDLMPADILGTEVVIEDDEKNRVFEFRKGPIHSQIVLADEINRATPKTQSAMLQAMQEGTVSAGRRTYELPQPFFVLATQNPIEMEGTYPLPEAQLDRFLFKILVPLAKREDLREILSRTTGETTAVPDRAMDAADALAQRAFIRRIVAAENIHDYVARLILASHPQHEGAPDLVRRFIRYGSSPRGAQALTLAGKVYAAMNNRLQVDFSDIQRAAISALNHRLILNFEGEAEGIKRSDIVKTILDHVPEIT